MFAWKRFVLLTYTFLQAVCASQHQTQTVCYGELGCFHSFGVVPVPSSPSIVRTTFELYKRGTSHHNILAANNFKSHLWTWISHFDSSKDTKILIHGYFGDGFSGWPPRLARELLIKGDFNVIVVNWGHGSKTTYEQASANTFLVGAQLAELLKYLHQHKGLNYNTVHVIGHSLGAQTAGHTGRHIRTLARISGLDPADPHFSGQTKDKRLDASDASFVDVIHTDASRYVVLGGYGTHDAVGNIDFYPNAGEHQPGCPEHPLHGASITNITGIASSLSCSHRRAVEYYIESVNSKCRFHGHRCSTSDQFENGQCLGCPSSGCPIMGYDADKTKTSTGIYYLSTSGTAPFCGHEYLVEIHVSERLLHTYGEFIITLVGTAATSEPLKFDSLMQDYSRGEVERHVISSHVNLGTITSVKLEFVKATGLHAILAQSYIRVHSVVVEPAASSVKQTFCAHEQRINNGQTVTISSHSHC